MLRAPTRAVDFIPNRPMASWTFERRSGPYQWHPKTMKNNEKQRFSSSKAWCLGRFFDAFWCVCRANCLSWLVRWWCCFILLGVIELEGFCWGWVGSYSHSLMAFRGLRFRVKNKVFAWSETPLASPMEIPTNPTRHHKWRVSKLSCLKTTPKAPVNMKKTSPNFLTRPSTRLLALLLEIARRRCRLVKSLGTGCGWCRCGTSRGTAAGGLQMSRPLGLTARDCLVGRGKSNEKHPKTF